MGCPFWLTIARKSHGKVSMNGHRCAVMLFGCSEVKSNQDREEKGQNKEGSQRTKRETERRWNPTKIANEENKTITKATKRRPAEKEANLSKIGGAELGWASTRPIFGAHFGDCFGAHLKDLGWTG